MSRVILIYIFFLLLPSFSSAQDKQPAMPDTLAGHSDTVARQGNGYVFWFVPSRRDNIYGIAFGLFGSEIICNVPNIKKSHGVNIQLLGQGFFIPFSTRVFGYKNMFARDTCWGVTYKDSLNYRAVHNGILLSTFGTMTDVSNGIVLSGWFSLGKKANGLVMNALANKYTFVNGIAVSISNETYQTNGIQIGLINRTRKLRGFQFGLWNVNDKRKLPLINWCFKP